MALSNVGIIVKIERWYILNWMWILTIDYTRTNFVLQCICDKRKRVMHQHRLHFSVSSEYARWRSISLPLSIQEPSINRLHMQNRHHRIAHVKNCPWRKCKWAREDTYSLITPGLSIWLSIRDDERYRKRGGKEESLLSILSHDISP